MQMTPNQGDNLKCSRIGSHPRDLDRLEEWANRDLVTLSKDKCQVSAKVANSFGLKRSMASQYRQ